jgi:hypothetical protein
VNARELYIATVKKLSCPRCGTQTLGGDGFWSTSKPYCSYCGWNIERAKELESSLRQLSWSLPLIGAFFGAIAYFLKQEFALFPFLFLCALTIAWAVASWKRLKLLNESHPAVEYTIALASATTAAEHNQTQSWKCASGFVDAHQAPARAAEAGTSSDIRRVPHLVDLYSIFCFPNRPECSCRLEFG